jgi:hypothetical protein
MSAAVSANRGDVALGIIGATALHVVAAIMLFSAAEVKKAGPQILPMRTHMVAAPQGDVSVGVVQAPVVTAINQAGITDIGFVFNPVTEPPR